MTQALHSAKLGCDKQNQCISVSAGSVGRRSDLADIINSAKSCLKKVEVLLDTVVSEEIR